MPTLSTENTMENTSESNMEFCPNCGSMLYPKEMIPEDESGNANRKLYDYCRKCNYKQVSKRISIAVHVSSKKGRHFLASAPARVKDRMYDITLERTTKKPCINQDCPSKAEETNPEIVLLTNPNELKVTYLCSLCSVTWSDA